MRLYRSLVTISLACLLCTSAFAGKSKVGTTAYSFLKIGAGAKSLAMGGAFAGLADDESALYYNPAGIVSFRDKSVAASYLNYIADIQSGNLSLIWPDTGAVGVWAQASESSEMTEEEPVSRDSRSVFAFSATYLNYGKIDETDDQGEIIGDFGGSDMAFALTYSRTLAPRIAAGATAKFIYQKIDQYSSDALALDAGLLFRFRDNRTTLGLSASNLGVQLSGLSHEHKDPLPIIVRLGISHRVRELPLTVSGEGVYPSDNDIYGSLGIEISPNIPVAFRAGYSSFGKNYKTGGSKDNTAGLATGVGFKLTRFILDYAFLPYADLGSLHRVGFSYRW